MTPAAVRDATPADAPRLTQVARAAKAHWGYPPEWIARWSDALTISPEYIEAHRVFVAERAGTLVGVCALEERDGHWSLEHVWVDPASQGAGIGRALVEHALHIAGAAGPGTVMVESDPYAAGFYERMGGELVSAVPAPMPGAPDRVLPTLRFTVPRRS